MAQNNTLVYLHAKSAEFLRLKRLKGVALKLAGEIAALPCRYLSEDGPYLKVSVSYKYHGRTTSIVLSIPHQFVLLIVQLDKENKMRFAEIMSGCNVP
jgi:hypothetical protein